MKKDGSEYSKEEIIEEADKRLPAVTFMVKKDTHHGYAIRVPGGTVHHVHLQNASGRSG